MSIDKSAILRVITSTYNDTGIDKDILTIVIDCFLYELAEELAAVGEVEVPYIGEISLRTGKLIPAAAIKRLKKSGGSYAIKFRRAHERSIKRSAKRRAKSSRTSQGLGTGEGISEDAKERESGSLPEVF